MGPKVRPRQFTIAFFGVGGGGSDQIDYIYKNGLRFQILHPKSVLDAKSLANQKIFKMLPFLTPFLPF